MSNVQNINRTSARQPKVRSRTPRPAQPKARKLRPGRDPYHGQAGPALAQVNPRYRDPRGRQTGAVQRSVTPN
jgi:hypothetical protein